MYVNLDQWAQLPPAYKAVFEAACAETNNWMQAKYDAENPAALRRWWPRARNSGRSRAR